MKKVIAIVACLCKIHNWLIDSTLGPISTHPIPPSTDDDALAMAVGGGVPLERRMGHAGEDRLPNQLLDAGEHFDDDPSRTLRRSVAHPVPPTTVDGRRDSNRLNSELLPRDNLRLKVEAMGLRRPPANVRNN